MLHCELRLRAFDRRLIRFHQSRGGVGCRTNLLGSVLRNNAAVHELRLALGRELLILGVGGISRELRFGLIEQRLVADESGLRLL